MKEEPQLHLATHPRTMMDVIAVLTIIALTAGIIIAALVGAGVITI